MEQTTARWTWTRGRKLAAAAALFVAYAIAGKLALRLAFVHPSATAVWPPTGIALAGFLILGRRVWPAVFAGAFLVNVTTAGGPVVSLAIAAGNTLEGLLGSYLLERWAGGREAFDHPAGVVKFTVFAALLSTVAAATIGTTSLIAGGVARAADAGAIFLTWWLGDAGGDLVVAPLILLARVSYGLKWGLARAAEAAALALACVVVALTVFGGLLQLGENRYPLAFLPMPVFIWAAMRFGRRGAAVAVALVYAVAVRGTLDGFGPFARYAPNQALLLLQVFTVVASLTALTLAAVSFEGRRMVDQLSQLAVTDPVTGLANYRGLFRILESEVQRSLRTARPFAVVFLDVNELKGINDRYGHLIGSRALVRVAEVLRRACRAIDTAARYGGDEFALVLPETDEVAAQLVARRVGELMAEDAEQPPISVSFGASVFPTHGETAHQLLAAADRALYGDKARTAARPRASFP